jgi:hypothetical protein
MTTLDQQIDTSLQEILRRRKTKLTLVVVGLVVALGSMMALTALMYSPSAGDAGEDRIGAESFR